MCVCDCMFVCMCVCVCVYVIYKLPRVTRCDEKCCVFFCSRLSTPGLTLRSLQTLPPNPPPPSIRVCDSVTLSFYIMEPTHTHRHTQTHTDTHKHTQAHTDTHKHTQAHTDTHKHTQTHTDTHRHTQAHTDTHKHTQTHTRAQSADASMVVGRTDIQMASNSLRGRSLLGIFSLT